MSPSRTSGAKSRKPKNIKIHNEKLVISFLRGKEYTTAAEISRQLNLSITTIAKILATLQKNKVVNAIGKGHSTNEGGKKPELFALNPSHRYAVGCGVSIEHAQIVLVDFCCQKVDEKLVFLKNPKNFEASMEELAGVVKELIEENSLTAEQVCGVAVGFDGIVNPEAGTIICPIHNLSWGEDVPAREVLQKYLPDLPIYINNGGRYGAYALYLYHPEYKEQTVFTVSSSVGCLLKQGKMDVGAGGMLGEIGHMTIMAGMEGPECACGNFDCFEDLVSGANMINHARELAEKYPQDPFCKWLDRTDFTTSSFFRAAEAKSPVAMAVVDRIATYYAAAIRNILLICDPQLIVMMGPDSNGEGYFSEKLREKLKTLPFLNGERKLNIFFHETWELGTSLLGAALFSIDEYLMNLELD